jgi:protocatechuate 3,4-dioxygenase beta subunit
MHLCKIVLLLILGSSIAGCKEHVEPVVQYEDTPMVVPVPEPKAPVEEKKIVGGSCDGCELMYVGMPERIQSIDTSDGWKEKGKKILVTGTVYKLNGVTPAPNVLMYYWQTNTKGLYAPEKGMNELAIRHGHIRGWIKTDEHGHYAIYTIRPAPYPDGNIPAHIHLSVREPELDNEYFIDELVFDDDKLLTPEHLASVENRGGSGILHFTLKDRLLTATHDIILGKNIPDYPAITDPTEPSGLEIGEVDPSFTPFHAYGPDKCTSTCPLCKYGGYHGILFFVGNHPNWSDIKKWVLFLEEESVARSAYMRAFFVYGNENNYNQEAREKELEAMGEDLDIKYVALTFVPSMTDTATEVFFNKINPNVENTFIVYQQGEIIDKYVNLPATPDNYKRVVSSFENTMKEFLNIKAPRHQ